MFSRLSFAFPGFAPEGMWELASSLSLRLQPLLQGGCGSLFSIAIALEMWELSSLSLSGSDGSLNVWFCYAKPTISLCI